MRLVLLVGFVLERCGGVLLQLVIEAACDLAGLGSISQGVN